jgi:hypothetical protein
VDDPEVAEMMAEREAADKKAGKISSWHPPQAEWTILHGMVAEVRDFLADILVVTGKGLPSDGPRRFIDRYPRPRTELEKARLRIAEREDVRYMEQMDDAIMAAKQRWRDQQAQQAAEMAGALEE